jgi:hypothetical protein
MEENIMGLILNNNVEETKIMSAYGLTVYGKINRYVWTLEGNREENALINIIIVSNADNELLFSMQMGNRSILQCRIDDTMDNFLYWITTEKPDTYSIEKQVYKSLCQFDSLFNHLIRQKKDRQRKADAERQRMEEAQKKERAAVDSITDYSNVNGLIPAFTYEKVYLIKALTEKAQNVIKTADNKHIEGLLQFMESHPDNTDARIIKSGTIEEVLQYIA